MLQNTEVVSMGLFFFFNVILGGFLVFFGSLDLSSISGSVFGSSFGLSVFRSRG